QLQDHLYSGIKLHFDLIVKFVETLQVQLFRLKILNKEVQEEIKQLKMQLNQKKNEDEQNILRVNYQTELLEKDNAMKKIQRELQQELLKLRADIEIMKKNFIEKEKYCNEFIKTLQEKDEKLIQYIQNVSSTEEKKDNDNTPSFNPKYSSTFSFDLFCASSKLLKTFTGHTSWVWSIDYATFDCGQFLCSGSEDRTVRVWNVETAKQIQLFNGHSHHLRCVKFSPFHHHCHGVDNRYPTICSSSVDKTIRFWDFETSKEFQVLKGHTEGVAGITFSPFHNSRYLCSGSYDKTIRLWDVETSKSLHAFNGHTNCVWCVDISPLQSNDNNKSNNIGVIGGNGYTICSGSHDKTIRIWDIETAKELILFNEHENVVRSVKYSPYETNTICSGSNDYSVRLWDIRSKKAIHVFKGHTNTVWAIEFVGNNSGETAICNTNIICSGSEDNTVRFWDIRTNRQLHVIKGNGNEDNGIISLYFSLPKNKDQKNKNTDDHVCGVDLCYGSNRGPIRIWG
ncbi:WD-40 repeat protein, partial [Reticulomyxa filosa]